MQEMKEKELMYLGNGDANSHICKVCFESPTAAILLPCRHFCCESFEPNPSPPLPQQGGEKKKSLPFFVVTSGVPVLQCVNLVRLHVLSVPFVAQTLRIGFLHLLLDTALFNPPNEGSSKNFFFLCHKS